MGRVAILAKTQKRHEGKSERGGCNNPPPLLRERVIKPKSFKNIHIMTQINTPPACLIIF